MSEEGAFYMLVGLFVGSLFGWVCRGSHERALRWREQKKETPID